MAYLVKTTEEIKMTNVTPMYDISFDVLPATQVTPEYIAIKFHTKKAEKIWKEWSPFITTDYRNRLETVDILYATSILKNDPKYNYVNKHNPLNQFLSFAKTKGLVLNRTLD